MAFDSRTRDSPVSCAPTQKPRITLLLRSSTYCAHHAPPALHAPNLRNVHGRPGISNSQIFVSTCGLVCQAAYLIDVLLWLVDVRVHSKRLRLHPQNVGCLQQEGRRSGTLLFTLSTVAPSIEALLSAADAASNPTLPLEQAAAHPDDAEAFGVWQLHQRRLQLQWRAGVCLLRFLPLPLGVGLSPRLLLLLVIRNSPAELKGCSLGCASTNDHHLHAHASDGNHIHTTIKIKQ